MLSSMTTQPFDKDNKGKHNSNGWKYKQGAHLTYLHSGNAASGKVPEDIKSGEEQAPFIRRDLVPHVCSASAKQNRRWSFNFSAATSIANCFCFYSVCHHRM